MIDGPHAFDTFDYSQALANLAAGNKVRRTSWDKTLYVKKQDKVSILFLITRDYFTHEHQIALHPYQPTDEDKVGTDWTSVVNVDWENN